MIIGIPKEIKDKEGRVGLAPCFVANLIKQGNEVMVEKDAGIASGFLNEEYLAVGAKLLNAAEEVYAKSDMIVKIKEPIASEYTLIRKDQIIFCYMHLSSNELQTQALIASKAICIAYETVTDAGGRLPLLAPMSSIAGRASVLMGAHFLQKHCNGSGTLISSVPGVAKPNVVIIGAGNVGTNAAQIAHGLMSNVTVFDNNLNALRAIDNLFGGRVSTVFATQQSIHAALGSADIVIGATLIPGSNAPKVITKNMVRSMKPGSVIVDVAIDQGGCSETSQPTTHTNPTYLTDGVVHYCVTNIPGAYPNTATIALNNATYPYIEKLAKFGYKKALKEDPGFMNGLNVCAGHVTYKGVAEAQKLEYVEPSKVL